MTEFKVGDRVRSGEYKSHKGRDLWVVKEYDGAYMCSPNKTLHPEHTAEGSYCYLAEWLRHATPVPIGYTGKLRDMDLKEGDVVENRVSGVHYTMKKDKAGVLKCCLVTVDDSYQDYTLISRAKTANSPAWSKWRMSKEDSTIQETWDDIETHPIPDMAHQVLYRGRNIPPVTHEFEVDGVAYAVDVKGGVPDWGSVELVK